jgi:hypothetical protein
MKIYNNAPNYNYIYYIMKIARRSFAPKETWSCNMVLCVFCRKVTSADGTSEQCQKPIVTSLILVGGFNPSGKY